MAGKQFRAVFCTLQRAFQVIAKLNELLAKRVNREQEHVAPV